MIKNIPFGGIDRKSSFRTADAGDCEESLNVRMEKGEITASPQALSVTENTSSAHSLGLPGESEGFTYDVLFVHKGSGYEKFICKSGNNIGVWTFSPSTTLTSFLTLSGETFKDITSVGNTLVIATSLHTYYVLYKNGSYINLGYKVPLPVARLEMAELPCNTSGITQINNPWGTNVADVGSTSDNTWLAEKIDDNYSIINALVEMQKAYNSNGSIDVSTEIGMKAQELQDQICGKIQRMDADLFRRGIYPYPVWGCYGVRLFDGSVICHTPVLFAAGADYPYRIVIGTDASGGSVGTGGTKGYINVERKHAYKIYLAKESVPANFGDWADIISSVDIYTSTPIGQGLAYSKGANRLSVISGDQSIWEVRPGNASYKFEDDLVNSSSLYLLKRYSVGEFNTLSLNTYNLIDSTSKIAAEDRVTQEMLKDADFTHYEFLFNSLESVNNRVLGIGVKEKRKVADWMLTSRANLYSKSGLYLRCYKYIDTGTSTPLYQDVTAFMTPIPTSPASYKFEIGFKQPAAAGQIISNMDNIVNEICGTTKTIGGTNLVSCPIAILSCPEINAESLQIRVYNGSSVTATVLVNLKTASLYGMSYYLGNINQSLYSNLISQSATTWQSDTNINYDKSDYIYQSEADSPFTFPVSGRHRMSANVLHICTATLALSEGQFGQYPLYVFTDRGIWAMNTSETGTLTSSRLVSQDTILPNSKPRPLEQSVVFFTERGLMELVSSNVTCLSEDINGWNKSVEAPILSTIAGVSAYALFASSANYSPIRDTTSFNDFVKYGQIIYDYSGKRLVIFSTEQNGNAVKYPFQYVFDTETRLWHKEELYTGNSSPAFNYELKNAVNSFPESYVVAANSSGNTAVLNYNTLLDGISSTPLRGIIITKTLDLDAPDSYKTIKDIKLRGAFTASNHLVNWKARYALYGSNDGITFKLLSSLNGQSCKFFKILVLTNLIPAREKLSYIQVDYETRFIDKLR